MRTLLLLSVAFAAMPACEPCTFGDDPKCKQSTSYGSGFVCPSSTGAVDDRGTELTPKGAVYGNVQQFAWSADDTEIFYIGDTSLSAVRVADGQIRTVANEHFEAVGVAADSGEVFGNAWHSDLTMVNVETMQRYPLAVSFIGDSQFVVSANGRYIAGGDPIAILDTTSGKVTSTNCIPEVLPPAVFSPAGDELLCAANDGTFDNQVIIDIASGTQQPFRKFAAPDALVWNDSGIESLVGENSSVYQFTNYTTGSVQQVNDHNFEFGVSAISADGENAAQLGFTDCASYDASCTCTAWSYPMWLDYLSEGTSFVIATGLLGYGAERPQAEFSHDGQTLAYTFEGALYVHPVRP